MNRVGERAEAGRRHSRGSDGSDQDLLFIAWCGGKLDRQAGSGQGLLVRENRSE